MVRRDLDTLRRFQQQSAATAILAGALPAGFQAFDIVVGLHVTMAKKMGILPEQWSDAKCELILHKYRYEMKEAPPDKRMESRRWLEQRNFHRLNLQPWPEGDLP